MKIRLLTNIPNVGRKGMVVDVPLYAARVFAALNKAVRVSTHKPVQVVEPPKPKRIYRRRKKVEEVQVEETHVASVLDATVTLPEVETGDEINQPEAASTE